MASLEFRNALGAFCLILAVSALSSVAHGDARFNLDPGDRFSTRIDYSNLWVDGPVFNRKSGRGTRDIGLGTLDPLFVTMVLHGRVPHPEDRREPRVPGDSGRALEIVFTPEFSKIRYHDARGHEWTMTAEDLRGGDKARGLLADVVAGWRNYYSDRLLREMFEEQFLGLGLAFLGGAEFTARIPSRNSDPVLPDFEKVMKRHLPADYPNALREHLTWYFREAVTRTIAPKPDALQAGSGFLCRGVPYRVKRVDSKRVKTAVLHGGLHRESASTTFRDEIHIEIQSGLILKAEALTLRDRTSQSNYRHGRIRWISKLVDFSKDRPDDSAKAVEE